MSESAPCCSGGDGYKSRYAGRGCGGEQCVDVWNAVSTGGANWQGQKKAAYEYCAKET